MDEREHQPVLVPRVSANDDHVTLVAWLKEDGEAVAAGEKLCEVESSKSVVEVTAPCDGWLFRLHQPGEEVAVARPLAVISGSPDRPDPHSSGTDSAEGIKVTAKARQLIEANGIPLEAFRGVEIVKEKHVRDYLESQRPADDESAAEGELLPLTPIRRRAARTLAESKQTIPHSYLHRWLPAAAVGAHLARLCEAHGLMLTVSDLLVAAVAGAAATHPEVNASWRDNGIFRHARAHVGFALNQADGELLVPVVKDADRLPLEDLVGRIRGLQKRAIRHKLAPDELAGGTITVTSLVGTGVHQVLPIVVPGQAAIVAIGDPCPAPPADAYCLSVAFDHRVVNGAEAAGFLAAVAEALEGGKGDGNG